MIAFTLCANNYLPYAFSLGESLKSTNPNVRFVIGLVDKKLKDFDYLQYEVIEVKDIVAPDLLEEMAAIYSITELSTAVKPFYFKHFFDKSEESKVMYFDPDIRVYSSLENLESYLGDHDVVLTPHMLKPPLDDKDPTDRSFLATGVYNLGFVGFRKSKESEVFLDWWSEKLITQSYGGDGLFFDQLWMSYAPCFLQNVKILHDPGYNVANWNLHERVLNKTEDTFYVNSVHPLVFFHFSNYKIDRPHILAIYNTRYSVADREDLREFLSEYVDLISNYIEMVDLQLEPYYGIRKRGNKLPHEIKGIRKLLLNFFRKGERFVLRY